MGRGAADGGVRAAACSPWARWIRAALQGGDGGARATATAATDAAAALAAPLEVTDGGVDPDAGSDTRRPRPPRMRPTTRRGLPDAPEPAFTIPTPTPLAADETAAIWAPVRQAVAARSQPSANSPTVARIEERTPEGTRNVVQVLERVSRGARVWVRVRVAACRTARRAGFPGDARRLRHRPHAPVVDRVRLRATLVARRRADLPGAGRDRHRRRADAARALLRARRLSRYASPFYGPVAFGTSARSPSSPTGRPAASSASTAPIARTRPRPRLARLHPAAQRDILAAARLMPVGTPVTIR